jgi:hypothetical protein
MVRRSFSFESSDFGSNWADEVENRAQHRSGPSQRTLLERIKAVLELWITEG